MPVGETKSENVLAKAAMAAAAGALGYGLRHVLEESGGPPSRNKGDDQERGLGEGISRAGPVLAAAWEFAGQTLLPIAEDAAHAAGLWVAENAPELVRERVVRRFIDAFNQGASATVEIRRALPTSE